jgi:hypothetical protein
MGQQGMARLGEAAAAAHAVEQGNAQPVFEQLDAPADRRLRAMQPLTGAGEATCLGNRQEGADFIDVHDQESR